MKIDGRYRAEKWITVCEVREGYYALVGNCGYPNCLETRWRGVAGKLLGVTRAGQLALLDALWQAGELRRKKEEGRIKKWGPSFAQAASPFAKATEDRTEGRGDGRFAGRGEGEGVDLVDLVDLVDGVDSVDSVDSGRGMVERKVPAPYFCFNWDGVMACVERKFLEAGLAASVVSLWPKEGSCWVEVRCLVTRGVKKRFREWEEFGERPVSRVLSPEAFGKGKGIARGRAVSGGDI